MKLRTITVIFALLISFSAHSGPARKGLIYLTQPDGTSFAAKIRGDEFMKIVTTADGHSISQDAEGWWCYAYYDEDGAKIRTDYRIGEDAPADIRGMSIDIPMQRLMKAAARMRASARRDPEPVLSRIMKARGVHTKGEANEKITKYGLVILAQFKDVSFKHTQEDFVNMLMQEGYSTNGATGSAKEYFNAQFNGIFDFSFDVSRIVTLPKNVSEYGRNGRDGNDIAPDQMVIDACKLVDDEIDFSLYDDDGDGIVDNVFVFFAGGDEAEGAGDDRIWSHSWYIYSGADKNLFLDGKRIDRYACTAELTKIQSGYGNTRNVLAGIGTFCHEYFHTFDLPDLYDTDYEGSGGIAAGMWSWTSLMDAGNQNNSSNTPPYINAIEREILGTTAPVLIEADGSYSLEPIGKSGKYYRINTDYENEYYLIECRSNEGWDEHIGGEGMLVYHIDKSDRKAGYSDTFQNVSAAECWQENNEVNVFPDHQCADLIEADGRKDQFSAAQTFYTSADNIRGIFFPSSSVNSLLPDSKPGLAFWSGQAGEISITNIQKTDNGVTFNVIGFGGETEMPPAVASTGKEVFADAAIIQFESDREYAGEATVQWGRTGKEDESIKVTPYDPGKYSITLEGLENNRTYTAKIHFELNGIVGEEKKVSFMTKMAPSVKWAFIFMGGIETNDDGTLPPGTKLPLRLYNAQDAREIRWEFDGTEITAEGDGYFTVSTSGDLKAHITWEDGSEETILKKIQIREDQR